MSEPAIPIKPPAEVGRPLVDPTPPLDDGDEAANRSCPKPETLGQLVNRILAAAKVMEQCEMELAEAEVNEQKAEAACEAAAENKSAADSQAIGKAFTLGRELDTLDQEMKGSKGKHKEVTFRKRAILLLDTKNAVYRPLAIYRFMVKRGITSEEAAIQYASDIGESYSKLAETAQQKDKPPHPPTPARKSRGTKLSVPKADEDEPDDDGDEDDADDADDAGADDEDVLVLNPRPELSDDERKRAAALGLFACFDARCGDTAIDAEPAPEAVTAAVGWLISNYFPGGWAAAQEWMATHGAAVPEEKTDDVLPPVNAMEDANPVNAPVEPTWD